MKKLSIAIFILLMSCFTLLSIPAQAAVNQNGVYITNVVYTDEDDFLKCAFYYEQDIAKVKAYYGNDIYAMGVRFKFVGKFECTVFENTFYQDGDFWIYYNAYVSYPTGINVSDIHEIALNGGFVYAKYAGAAFIVGEVYQFVCEVELAKNNAYDGIVIGTATYTFQYGEIENTNPPLPTGTTSPTSTGTTTKPTTTATATKTVLEADTDDGIGSSELIILGLVGCIAILILMILLTGKNER